MLDRPPRPGRPRGRGGSAEQWTEVNSPLLLELGQLPIVNRVRLQQQVIAKKFSRLENQPKLL